MSHRVLYMEKRWLAVAALAALALVGWGTEGRWWPIAAQRFASLRTRMLSGGSEAMGVDSTTRESMGAAHTDHDGHDHSSHEETDSIELSPQARKSIGLETGQVKLTTFVRTSPGPGIVVERHGRTKTRVVAPLTGIVTQVHVIEGEAVEPGRPLFELRLTHEDLVQSQVEFLRITEELDVVNREVERLRPVAEKGTIPQKTLLERQYEQQKLRGGHRALRESLLLHGLSPQQVDEVQETRTLCSNLTVFAPGTVAPGPGAPGPGSESRRENPGMPGTTGLNRRLVVEDLQVELGRLVTAGDALLALADYSELYIEGKAFEQDGQLVAAALRERWEITAVVENPMPSGTDVPNLSILYLKDQIDVATRTLNFYLKLPNELIRDEEVDGHRFINWRFKPGQRTQLRVPVQRWPDRIVLPAGAVIQEGAESFVFQENGDHFDRRPVQVEYRDLRSVVVADDGTLFPDDVVATSGAAQLQIALKNKSGGAIDPHAGHTH
ncbi:MAG: efflux RND transporter periplasmic adaptor subunit [Planctomycetaceae bacterium]